MAFPLIPSIAVCLLLLLGLYKFILHPAFVSPLSSIPAAHWSARFSPVWIIWRRYQMRNNETTLAAHQAHGEIVLLGPNEISINCVDGGLRVVYAGGFEKHDWYERLFPSYNVINMFSTLGHADHSAKKRLLSNIYSKSYLASSSQVAANSRILLSQRLLPMIESQARVGKAIEVHEVNRAFTMDFMSAYQFGLSSSTNLTQDVPLRKKALHEYYYRKEFEFYHQEVPWLRDLSRWLGCPVVPQYARDANDFIEAWNQGLCDRAEKSITSNQALPTGDDPVVYRQFRDGLIKLNGKGWNKNSGGMNDNDDSNEKRTQRLELASEMLDHLGAGHETSAIALTYLFWELSRRPGLQAQLRQELYTLEPRIIWPPPSSSKKDETTNNLSTENDKNLDNTSFLPLPTPKQLDALPLLHAILMETLRLHTPIPGTEPRITPAGGCTLAGYANIPGGVRVSAMAHTLHRNADVFPEPESFKPERWIENPVESEHGKEMLRWFWAFGSGGRMCIGSHLAIQEIKLIVAAVITNWSLRWEGEGKDDMRKIDAYTTRPEGNTCFLSFEHV